MAKGEVDLGLLIWALERGVRADAFEDPRTIVRLEFTDQPRGKRLWWFVNEADRCELCLEDPGFEVDLYLCCTLVDMIYIVRGDLALTRAISDGKLEVLGQARVRRKLRSWLNLNPLTKIKSQRAPAAAS